MEFAKTAAPTEKEQAERRRRVSDYRQGRDELNLAEFPLAAISNRFLDGTKTVVFSEQVWDDEKKMHVPRSLTVSGSDRYGLPTAKDDDVLLACVQLSSIGDFHSREVQFSRYELLKLLRWKDETKNYRRLATSLRRWKGVTVYSDRAFYDHARKSWVNRDFGIFDNVYLYEREEREGISAPASSWLVWNEVIFESFSAGYLKRLDWDLYCRLEDPVAKRLYRFLDKRFYHRDELVFYLEELAINKVRISPNYDTAQMKRALTTGIRELEDLWELQSLDPEKRFRRVSRGKWEVVFVRKAKPKRASAPEPAGLERELITRNVSREVARELAAANPQDKIQSMIELFDWHNTRGEKKGPGFLVAAIKDPSGYVLPTGFQTQADKARQKQSENSRKAAERESQKRKELARQADAKRQEGPFWAFWDSLSETQQEEFERDALARAEATKREGYLRTQAAGGTLFEQYRFVILKDHFSRTQLESLTTATRL